MANAHEPSCRAVIHRQHGRKRPLNYLVVALFLLCPASSQAQSSGQQFVFGSTSTSANTSAVAGFSKDSATGTLTLVPGSPFNERNVGGSIAIDGLGHFLFVLNPGSNNISMFQINSTTGAIQEVPNSPFAAVPSINPNQAPSTPVHLAADKSGQFLFVGYRSGNSPEHGAVSVFTIDATNLRLEQSQSTDIPSSPIGLATDPKSLHLYIGLGPNVSTGIQDPAQVYSIDSVTGNLSFVGSAGGGNETVRSDALDPLDRFFFDGWGSTECFLDSALISPVDGTASVSSTLSLGMSNFPDALLAESGGKFLYVSQSGGTFAYSIDQTTGALTLLPGGPTPLSFSTGTAAADPMGPYIYALANTTIQGFQVNSQTGALTSIASVSTGGQGILGVAISGQPKQAASGPVATLFPSTVSFGAATVGQVSALTRIASVVNTGNQALSLNAIQLTGANASDFTATPAPSCQPPTVIQPNANCAISVNFTPGAVGPRQAFLTATDNAPGSPQSLTITGSGVAAASAVTLIPGSITFASTTQGTTSPAQVVTVTNHGTANLNIFSVALSGANPGDFSLTNNCTLPVAVGASCTLSVSFSPLSANVRIASVILTDDAPNSPQVVELTGNAPPDFTIAPATGGSLTATVSAGQTAQFALQAVPGTSFSGTLGLACSGAPQNSKCSAPASVQLAGGTPSNFSVTVATMGNAANIPLSNPFQFLRFAPLRFVFCFLFYCALCFATARARNVRGLGTVAPSAEKIVVVGSGGFMPPVPFLPSLSSLLLFLVLSLPGCGGGSSASSAQTLVPTPSPSPSPSGGTPSGTSTLTLAISVTSANGKQLTPPAPVLLTLTVN